MNNSQPFWTKDIKLIAWDLDGTLYPNSEELTQAIELHKTKTIAAKLDVSDDQAREVFDKMYQRFNSHTKTLNELGINGHEFFVDFWMNTDLTPFIKSDPELALKFLRLSQEEQYTLFILTNSNTVTTVRGKLDLVGINSQVFEKIITSVDLGINKPDPRAFESLLDDGNFAPNEIVYIGDRENTDILPAKKLGMHTILISDSLESAADETVRDAGDAIDLFLNQD